MREFKVGDRVKCFQRDGIGTILELDYGLIRYANIKFDGEMDVYSCALSVVEKVMLPQPQKSLLKSGDKVVYRNGAERWYIQEIEQFLSKSAENYNDLSCYRDSLTAKLSPNKGNDIMQVYRNGELIMERTDKSKRELEVERIQAEMANLSKRLDELK